MPIANDLASFYAALNACTGGETIVLLPGNYGDSNYWYNGINGTATVLFTSTVTVKSADPNNPASFSSFLLNGVQNIKFQWIEVDYVFDVADPWYYKPFEVHNSTNIEFRGCSFLGDNAVGTGDTARDGFPNGYGFFGSVNNGLSFYGCLFQQFILGVSFTNCQNVTVDGNEFDDMAADAMNFRAITTVYIARNYMHDWRISDESGAHPDGIQFFTNASPGDPEYSIPSTNITIEYNYIDQADGSWTQSIFMRNELVDQNIVPTLFYENITIRHNLIINGHLHGITVGEAHGVLVDSNTILQSANPYTDIPIVGFPTINMAEDSTDVVVSNNITSVTIATQPAGQTFTNNIVKQFTNPAGANYSAIVVSGVADGTARIALGAGASGVTVPDLSKPTIETWTLNFS